MSTPTTRTTAIGLGLLIVMLTGTASAEPPAVEKAPAAAPAAATAPSSTAPKTGDTTGKRRLNEIHIEGEIPVPQVLFITARDQRRFMDLNHKRYLRTCRQVAEATRFASRIVLIDQPAASATVGTDR